VLGRSSLTVTESFYHMYYISRCCRCSVVWQELFSLQRDIAFNLRLIY